MAGLERRRTNNECRSVTPQLQHPAEAPCAQRCCAASQPLPRHSCSFMQAVSAAVETVKQAMSGVSCWRRVEGLAWRRQAVTRGVAAALDAPSRAAGPQQRPLVPDARSQAPAAAAGLTAAAGAGCPVARLLSRLASRLRHMPHAICHMPHACLPS